MPARSVYLAQMLRRLHLVPLTATAIALVAAPASAQDGLPDCPPREEAITTTLPEFMRTGGSFTLRAERDTAFDVDAIHVTYSLPPPATVTTETFSFASEYDSEIRVIRGVPDGRSFMLVRVSWIQDEGTPAACRGEDVYEDIPIIPQGARAGDLSAARLSGLWAVRYGSGGKGNRARWRLTPTCDFFGCRTRLRSNSGYSGHLRLDGRSRYRFRTRELAATCVLEFADGTRTRYRIFRYTTVTITPSRVRRGVARAFVGRRVARYDAPADEFDICNDPRTERDVVRGSRL